MFIPSFMQINQSVSKLTNQITDTHLANIIWTIVLSKSGALKIKYLYQYLETIIFLFEIFKFFLYFRTLHVNTYIDKSLESGYIWVLTMNYGCHNVPPLKLLRTKPSRGSRQGGGHLPSLECTWQVGKACCWFLFHLQQPKKLTLQYHPKVVV